MLADRTASQNSTFTIQNADSAGVKIDALSASWELFDERGNSIDAGVVADFNSAIDFITFEIEGVSLTLPEGEVAAGRELVVTLLDTNNDEREIRDYFVLVSPTPLAVTSNSFVTFPEALAIRRSFGALDGWDANDPGRQQSALVEAHRRLCQMGFSVPGYTGNKANQKSAAYGTGSDDAFHSSANVRLATLSLSEFDTLPEAFRKAVKRAQMAEANVLLGGDPIVDKRKSGLISETVGESSAFFQSKPYLNLPISRQAYEEVRRYIRLRVSIKR